MTEKHGYGPRRDNTKFAVGTAAGVICGAVLATTVFNLVPSRSASATPGTSAVPSQSAAQTPSTQAPVSPAGSSAGTPSSATPSAPATGDVVTDLPRLSYVAVFRWLPKSTNSETEASAYAKEHAKEGFQVVAVDGDLINKPGNWGIGVVNLADFSDATRACKAMGFSASGKDCFRRAVS